MLNTENVHAHPGLLRGSRVVVKDENIVQPLGTIILLVTMTAWPGSGKQTGRKTCSDLRQILKVELISYSDGFYSN